MRRYDAVVLLLRNVLWEKKRREMPEFNRRLVTVQKCEVTLATGRSISFGWLIVSGAYTASRS